MAKNLPTKLKDFNLISYANARHLTHRAMRSKIWSHWLLLQMMIVIALSTFGIFKIWPLITFFWEETFMFWIKKLEIGSQIALRMSGTGWLGNIPSPYVHSNLPTLNEWYVGTLITIIIFIGSFLMPPSFTPIKYLLRFIATIQASAQVYFMFFAAQYPYSAAIYLNTMVETASYLIFLVPLGFAMIYWLIIQNIWKYLLLTLMAVAYLILLTPIQYLVHAWILHHASLLYHPILYLLGGLLLQIFGLICLYAWAMSWQAFTTKKPS